MNQPLHKIVETNSSSRNKTDTDKAKKTITEGGTRAAHGKATHKLAVDLCTRVCDDKDLPYTINTNNHKIVFKDDARLYINPDITLSDTNKDLKYVIEIKEYMDSSMFKRFLYESEKIHKRYPITKFIFFENEKSMADDVMVAWVSESNLTDYMFRYTYSQRKRHSKTAMKSKLELGKDAEDFLWRILT